MYTCYVGKQGRYIVIVFFKLNNDILFLVCAFIGGDVPCNDIRGYCIFIPTKR